MSQLKLLCHFDRLKLIFSSSNGNWLDEQLVGDGKSSSHQNNQSETNFESVVVFVKKPEEPMAGPSSQAQGIGYQSTVAKIGKEKIFVLVQH